MGSLSLEYMNPMLTEEELWESCWWNDIRKIRLLIQMRRVFMDDWEKRVNGI